MWDVIGGIAALIVILGGGGLIGLVKLASDRREKRRQEKLRREFERPGRLNARKVVGRDEDVREVRAMLETGGQGAILPVATVTGGGGVGKTTLARHYMAVYRDRYDRAELIRASSEAQLMGDLAGLADRLERDNAPVEVTARAHHALEMIAERTKTESWLVVFDNVESPEVLKPWLPDGRKLHVLVTSRHPDWPAEGFETRPAGLLSPDNAVALLEQEAGRADAGHADLAKAVGYLPLALVQAGEWLAANPGRGAADYLARLNRLLEERDPASDDYDRSTGAVVRLTLQSLSPDARALMGILVWFAPDEISRDAFDALGWLRGRPRFGKWYRPLLWRVRAISRDEARLTAVWREVRLKALIEDDPTREGLFRMHRVTQLVGRRYLGRATQPARATALLAAVYPYDVQDSTNWPLCRRLTPHVLALWDTGEAPRGAALDFLLNQAAVFLNALADYAGGLALAEAGAELAESLHGADHPKYAVARHNLAMHRLEAGDRPGAMADMRAAVKLHEAHRPGSAALAESYDQLGHILHAMARAGEGDHLPEAIKVTQRGLALQRRLHGRWVAPVAASLNNLAGVRHTQGRGAAAARLYEASLRINRQVLPPGDARIAFGAMNTGSKWLEAGRADRAEPLLREALEKLRAAFVAEPDHPDLRNAASWLISYLLVRAAAGADAERREAEARALADEFGLDWAERQATARQYIHPPAG
ncbi:tetratricopeptide repeat protein [Roseovarius salinarum]|uniref:tetratricopeptide repeat protein n=1 Tax=Roseovarius salinarum TaxID=1981892 RepID=UPI000C34D5E9|nr:tetratricopeptide repeat protein [Roseovarius salinarum]